MAPSILTLVGRSTIGDIESVPQTFSSWNHCMSKAYCKWPVIAAIIIASLIVLSVVWCLARCLCCGLSCCCDCFSCFNCCDSCRGRRKSPARNADPASGAPPYQGYQGYQPSPGPPMYYPPQFASFDAPTKNGRIHEDSLPAMPSWDTATSRRVEDHSQQEDMEMDSLGVPPGQTTGVVSKGPRTGRGGYSQLSGHAESPYGHGPEEYHSTDPSYPHASDLGTQRLMGEEQDNTGYDHTGYDSGVVPTSPHRQETPYQDRYHDTQHSFGAGRPSYNTTMSSNDFHQPNQQGNTLGFERVNQPYRSYTPAHTIPEPYSPTDSTQYAPTTTLGPYNTSPTQVRPPSLLQAGRKPVQGSFREI